MWAKQLRRHLAFPLCHIFTLIGTGGPLLPGNDLMLYRYEGECLQISCRVLISLKMAITLFYAANILFTIHVAEKSAIWYCSILVAILF